MTMVHSVAYYLRNYHHFSSAAFAHQRPGGRELLFAAHDLAQRHYRCVGPPQLRLPYVSNVFGLNDA